MAPEQGRPTVDVDHRADIFAATQIIDDVVRLGGDDTAPPGRNALVDDALRRGHATDAADRHASIDDWRDDLHRALDPDPTDQSASRSRGRLVLLALLLAVLATLIVALVPRGADAPGEDPEGSTPAPQIIGPDELLLGDSAEYTHEDRLGSTYEWALPDGSTSDELTIQVTVETVDGVTIELTEDDGFTTRSNTLTISVRTQ